MRILYCLFRIELINVIINEVQKAHYLILANKREVDEDTRPGRFLLIGSSDVFSLPLGTEILADSIANLHLSAFCSWRNLRGEALFLKPSFAQSC